MEPRLSIFASAIRPHLWQNLLDSLRGSKHPYEVVFAGHIDQSLIKEMFNEYPEFKYITTGEIKPAQCYEIARRACTGHLVHWTADDAEYSPEFVDKIVEFWNHKCNMYSLISCKTNENSQNETMENHRFFGRNLNTPLMAPLGIMSRVYLNLIGGIDSRYICGQYENDIAMRVYANDGNVLLCEDVCINIEHANKHGKNTNFWSGYNEDREQLENSWVKGGYIKPDEPFLILSTKHSMPPELYFPITNREVLRKRNDMFVPYPKEISLTESYGLKGIWK